MVEEFPCFLKIPIGKVEVEAEFWSVKQTTSAIMHYPYWWRANSNVPDNCRKYFGRIHITKSQSSCTTPSTNNIQNHKCPIIFSAKWIKKYLSLTLWQYGLWSFQTGDTKLERFLPRKWLNFEFWINGEMSKSAKIWLSKSIFCVKNHLNLSQLFFHWRIPI